MTLQDWYRDQAADIGAEVIDWLLGMKPLKDGDVEMIVCHARRAFHFAGRALRSRPLRVNGRYQETA